MQDLAAALALVGVDLNIRPVHSRPGGGVHRNRGNKTVAVFRIQGIVAVQSVQIAQALRAHHVQRGGLVGVNVAVVGVKMLRYCAFQRVHHLGVVGVAQMRQHLRVGKLLPGGKIVMVRTHIVVVHRVRAGDLQAQQGTVPVADPDDVACVDKVIAGTGVQRALHQIAEAVANHLVDVPCALGVVVDLRHLVKVGVLDAVGVGVGKPLVIQRRDA